METLTVNLDGISTNIKRQFFEAAFGKNIKESRQLLIMPNRYIIYREDHKYNGAGQWNKLFSSLTIAQKRTFSKLSTIDSRGQNAPSEFSQVNAILAHYRKGKSRSSEDDLLF